MSWTYSNLADHLEECESAQEDEEFMSKPEGFDEDGNNYPRANLNAYGHFVLNGGIE